MAKVLTIEDEENLRYSIRRSLSKAGHEVSEAATLSAAREALREGHFDLVMTDVHLPDGSGADLVRELRGEGFSGAILVVTAFGTVESAVSAMRDGADDYLQKPVSLEEVNLVVARALERRRDDARLRLYRRMERARGPSDETLGESRAWRQTLATAARLARVRLPEDGSGPGALPTALLLGETGVGKGALARWMHAESGDADAPFVHVNCSAIPSALVESELFGHERGAFTDARTAREGLFEMADGGTIFLDEIGDMPLELQSKMLLTLERGEFRRVGGTKARRARARVIAATNQDLDARVREGAFRRDLLYRLNAFTLRLPPLREREGDVEEIAVAALSRFAREFGRPGLRLSAGARRALREHDWPGNVRELLNAVQRGAMFAEEDVLEAADLGLGSAGRGPAPAGSAGGGSAAGAGAGGPVFDFERGVHTAEDVERALIVQALAHCRGNVSRAAKLIGMHRGSLRYRIERYGLESAVREMAQ